jgi:peroxiredoxin
MAAMRPWTLCLVPLFSLAACSRQTPPTPDPASTPVVANTQAASPGHSGHREPARGPEVGQPAPDFTLKDYEGKSYHLADLRGKTVVLEWFNPDCPFVKAAHSKGSLKELARTAASKQVVWLAINSSGPGKQGNGAERVAAGKAAFHLDHPILADENGQVGHLYGATNTPHMFVIDEKGALAYKGAIDNSPDGEGESPTGGKLVNYVQSALDSLAAGKPVEVKETRAYGCGVKYGS